MFRFPYILFCHSLSASLFSCRNTASAHNICSGIKSVQMFHLNVAISTIERKANYRWAEVTQHNLMLIPCFFWGSGEGAEGMFIYEPESCHCIAWWVNLKDQSDYEFVWAKPVLLLTRMVLCPFRIILAILWPCGEAGMTGSFPCLSPSLTTCSKEVSSHSTIGKGWLESLSLCFRTYFTLWFLLLQVRASRELRNLPLAS